jgi:hypothetical protein
MGHFLGLGLTGFALYGIYLYATNAKIADILWLCFGALFAMTLLWSVLAPSLGTTRIDMSNYGHLQVWQIGGIGTFVWLTVSLISLVVGRTR